MSRVTQVISDVRSILSDASATRWSDNRLISLYNQCLKDIVIQSNILPAKVFVEIEANINTYTLPDDLIQINRIQYLDTVLPIVSHDKMDSSDILWETRTGTAVKYAISNLTDMNTFKIYPRITDATQDYITSNSNYGIIIDIATFDDVYNLPNIADLANIPKYMVVYYTKIPNVITVATIDADLQFSKIWDTAIVHYITGMALRDDADQQNRTFGAEELQLYTLHINNIIKREMVNFTSNADTTTTYNGGI